MATKVTARLVGESREHAALALSEAARLAAAYYGDENLGTRDYVMSPARDGLPQFLP